MLTDFANSYPIPKEHLCGWNRLKENLLHFSLKNVQELFYDEYLEWLGFGPLENFVVKTPGSVGLGCDCGTTYEWALKRFFECLHLATPPVAGSIPNVIESIDQANKPDNSVPSTMQSPQHQQFAESRQGVLKRIQEVKKEIKHCKRQIKAIEYLSAVTRDEVLGDKRHPFVQRIKILEPELAKLKTQREDELMAYLSKQNCV